MVADSPLFDEEWYAAQVGEIFDSRTDAAAHYVAWARDGSATPHPLFEPTWLYPGGRWRRSAPDPLSHYLARPDRAGLATHPLLPGDAEAWLRDAGPGTPLPKTTGLRVTLGEVREAAFATLGIDSVVEDVSKPPDVTVVLPVTDGFQRPCRWLRQLYRTEVVRAGLAIELLAVTNSAADRRMATLTALTLPGTRVVAGAADPRGTVTVEVDPTLEPPAWPWLHHLTARLARPGVGRVAPLLVEEDQTVVAAGALPGPFLRGETPADAARAAHLPVPDLWPGVVAYRTADGPDAGTAYVVPEARVEVPAAAVAGLDTLAGARGSTNDQGRPEDTQAWWGAAGFEGPGRPLRVVEGRPALRWAIDIAAPLAPRGRRWGDDPFARSLAAALERLGQWVTVDHPETRARASRDHDDVVLVLRGLEPVTPTAADADVSARLLWIISHPEDVTATECAAYDLVLAAGPVWAADRTAEWGRAVRPLLQCTDGHRFRPGLAEPDTGPEVLFVGNSRGELRPVVRHALDAGLDLTLYGDGWTDLVEPRLVSGVHVPNDRLGALYASAGVVLNDHWADMRAAGFVSNRTFDVLASGARLFSDDVAGLADLLAHLFEAPVPMWTGPEDLRRLAEPGWRDAFPNHAQRFRAAERVAAEHSFDARAATLLEAALTLTSGRRTPGS
ncbi:MAG: glycosyltransferase family protein [Nocardioides sp.]